MGYRTRRQSEYLVMALKDLLDVLERAMKEESK